ncbi:MAG TPA: rhodanese-like domain-containing protein [Fimbriimonadaceae bacterium]|nr:rhodanese-like domain-containing protein [Fimbriimonadaceae bacterium]
MKINLEKLDELRHSAARPMVIDVRSTGEFAAGHVPGAFHICMDEVEARLDDIPEDVPVVLVCHSGDRAGMVCELIEHDRPNAMVLEGGTEAWMNAGRPVVVSQKTRWSIERQVRLTAGLIVLSGTILALTVSGGWIYLAMFVGAGLTFAGLTNFCGMAALFALMPWNKPPRSTPDLNPTP